MFAKIASVKQGYRTLLLFLKSRLTIDVSIILLIHNLFTSGSLAFPS